MAGCVGLLSHTEQTENAAQRLFQKRKYIYSQKERSRSKAGFKWPSIPVLSNPHSDIIISMLELPLVVAKQLPITAGAFLVRGRKDCLGCHSNLSLRLWGQNLVLCPLLNQILAGGKALPLNYSCKQQGRGSPLKHGCEAGRRGLSQIRALREGEGETWNRPRTVSPTWGLRWTGSMKQLC